MAAIMCLRPMLGVDLEMVIGRGHAATLTPRYRDYGWDESSPKIPSRLVSGLRHFFTKSSPQFHLQGASDGNFAAFFIHLIFLDQAHLS